MSSSLYLRYCWEHVLCRENSGGLVCQVQPLQAGQRQQSGCHNALIQLAQPALHDPSKVLHLQGIDSTMKRWACIDRNTYALAIALSSILI